MNSGASTAAQPDLELRVLARLTRALPPVKGAGLIANAVKRVYARRERQKVEVTAHGLRLLLDPNEWLERELIFTPQLYDREMLRFLRENLGASDNFVDAGANVGIFGLLASRLAPRGKVLSIEADPITFQRLAEHVRMNDAKNLTPVNVGAAEAEDTMTFVPGGPGYRGTGNFYGAESGQKGIPVRVRPLLALLDEAGIDKMHGIKLDVEGFEYRVMEPFLREAPESRWPNFVIAEEFEPIMPHARGSVVKLLQTKGYELVWKSGADHILRR